MARDMRLNTHQVSKQKWALWSITQHFVFTTLCFFAGLLTSSQTLTRAFSLWSMPSHFVCSTLWFFAGFAMRLFVHALFSGVFFEPFSHPFLDYFWIPLLSPPSLHSPLQHTASHLKRRLEKMRDHDVMIGGVLVFFSHSLTHSFHMSNPILPIHQRIYFSRWFFSHSPILPICHTPFSPYLTDVFCTQMRRGSRWARRRQRTPTRPLGSGARTSTEQGTSFGIWLVEGDYYNDYFLLDSAFQIQVWLQDRVFVLKYPSLAASLYLVLRN